MKEYFVYKDLNTFSPEEYFSNITHWFGEYDLDLHKFKDENKEIPELTFLPFQFDFKTGKGKSNYIYEKYNIVDTSGKIYKCYIAVKIYLTQFEKEDLIPYCCCAYHSGIYVGRFKPDPRTCGCLNTPFYSQDVIDTTRAYKRKSWFKRAIAAAGMAIGFV